MTIRRLFLLMFATAVSAALAAAQPTSRATSMPDHWTESDTSGRFTPTLPSDDAWWSSFGDTLLNSLIARAEAVNGNATAALRRIDVARQAVREARASYFPSVGLSAQWQKSRSSGNTGSTPGSPYVSDYFSAGLSAQWQIDLFGRVRAQVAQARAGVSLSRADYASVMISLCSQLAEDYINLRTYQAARQVAVEHIAAQQRITEIAEQRHQAGLASQLDVSQARIVLLSTRATLPGIDTQIRSCISAIAVLIGSYTDEVAPLLEAPAPMPDCYQLVQIGVPADLLRRRPDIAQVEARIQADAAAVGIARADLLPTLSISGSIGTASHDLDRIGRHDSFTYSIAPQLSWTVFDGMARSARIASARETLQADIDTYNLTVLTAVNETERAITDYTTALQTIELQRKVVDESRRAVDLSVEMYTQGLTAFNNVVDAQISYLNNQNSLISAQGSALNALIALYQALGGGWN